LGENPPTPEITEAKPSKQLASNHPAHIQTFS